MFGVEYHHYTHNVPLPNLVGTFIDQVVIMTTTFNLELLLTRPNTDYVSHQGARWVILRNYRSDSSCIPIDGMALDIPVSTGLTHHPLNDMIVSLLMTLIEVITWMFKVQTYNMSLRNRLPDTAYHICPHYAYVKLHCQIWETATSTHDCHKSSFLNPNPNS